jgi:hypothetical protein
MYAVVHILFLPCTSRIKSVLSSRPTLSTLQVRQPRRIGWEGKKEFQ